MFVNSPWYCYCLFVCWCCCCCCVCGGVWGVCVCVFVFVLFCFCFCFCFCFLRIMMFCFVFVFVFVFVSVSVFAYHEGYWCSYVSTCVRLKLRNCALSLFIQNVFCTQRYTPCCTESQLSKLKYTGFFFTTLWQLVFTKHHDSNNGCVKINQYSSIRIHWKHQIMQFDLTKTAK